MFGKLSLFKTKRTDPETAHPVEEVFKYCPECGGEFRRDFEKCTLCDVLLVNGTSSGDRGNDENRRGKENLKIEPGDELVTIRSGALLEIKTLQHLLEKKFIGSMLIGDGANGTKSCCNSSSYELRVKSEDAEDAQALLIEDFKRTTALDSHDFETPIEAVFDQRSADANCPACGCSFVPDSRVCPECGLCF